MAELKKIEEEEFEREVLGYDDPVLVLFKVQWCPGCEQMVPVVKELADEGAKAFYVDVGESPVLAGRYGVMSIPTTIVFSGGEVKDTLVGPVGREKVEEALR